MNFAKTQWEKCDFSSFFLKMIFTVALAAGLEKILFASPKLFLLNVGSRILCSKIIWLVLISLCVSIFFSWRRLAVFNLMLLDALFVQLFTIITLFVAS